MRSSKRNKKLVKLRTQNLRIDQSATARLFPKLKIALLSTFHMSCIHSGVCERVSFVVPRNSSTPAVSLICEP